MKSRKSPKQSRSKITVEAILQATTHILLAGGAQALTTNHVAERAGVSIGSLYQYFPNKESLIAALIEQHVQQEVDCLSGVINDWDGELNIDSLVQIALIEDTKLLSDAIFVDELVALVHKISSH